MTFQTVFISVLLGLAFASFFGGVIASCKTTGNVCSEEYRQMEDLCGVFGGCMLMSLFLAATVYFFGG